MLSSHSCFGPSFTSACDGSLTNSIDPRAFHDVHPRVHNVQASSTTSSSLSDVHSPPKRFANEPKAPTTTISASHHSDFDSRAADGAHASSTPTSTSSTSSTASQTPHDRPPSRRRRCGCTDCDELLLHHHLRIQTFTKASSPSSTSPRLPPRVQHCFITMSTSTSRRQASASRQCSHH